MYFHLLNCAVVNAFILYKTVHTLKSHDPLRNQLGFEVALTKSMIKEGQGIVPKLFAEKTEFQASSTIGRSSTAMKIASREGMFHCPTLSKSVNSSGDFVCNRCRYTGCKKESRIWCDVCQVPLCLDSIDGNNHFKLFHQHIMYFKVTFIYLWNHMTRSIFYICTFIYHA